MPLLLPGSRQLGAPSALWERRHFLPVLRHGLYRDRIWHPLRMVSIPRRFASAWRDVLVRPLPSAKLRLAFFHEGATALPEILTVHAGDPALLDPPHAALPPPL